jgi:hypothetical protein
MAPRAPSRIAHWFSGDAKRRKAHTSPSMPSAPIVIASCNSARSNFNGAPIFGSTEAERIG